jgi:hypothetical protein
VRFQVLFYKTGFCLSAIAAVSSCATSSRGYGKTPAVDPAAVVQINRELQVPVGKARVYLQGGALIAGQNPDIGKTCCSVLMQNVHSPDEPLLKVLPDRFEITQLREYNDFHYRPRIYVASAGSTFSEWPINVIYSVEMRLDSPGQPNVRALICAKHSGVNMSWDSRSYYPNLAGIRSALGDIIEIQEP